MSAHLSFWRCGIDGHVDGFQYRLRQGFWKGVVPSLVMVINPTIQYVLYEWLARQLAAWRKKSGHQGGVQKFRAPDSKCGFTTDGPERYPASKLRDAVRVTGSDILKSDFPQPRGRLASRSST